MSGASDAAVAALWDRLVAGGWKPPTTPSSVLSEIDREFINAARIQALDRLATEIGRNDEAAAEMARLRKLLDTSEPDLIVALIALSNDLGGDSEGTIMQAVAEIARLEKERWDQFKRGDAAIARAEKAEAEKARLRGVVKSYAAYAAPFGDEARAALKPDTGETP